MQRLSRFRLVLVLLVIAWGCEKSTLCGDAGSATLSWEPSPEGEGGKTKGYRIHYGTRPGRYEKSIDVEDVTTYTVKGLKPGVRYYFSVTAYDARGRQSRYAQEAYKDVK